jgi:acyl-CoA synthetase (AMP-forming)/AMP-acid ligase II
LLSEIGTIDVKDKTSSFRGASAASEPGMTVRRENIMSDPLHAFPVVGEQTLRALARYPSRTAFSWPGGTMTYRAATDLIGRVQGVFAKLGFAPGTRVAFLTANRADAWCAGAAAQLSRLATTFLHPLGSLDDQLFQLEDSEAEMLIVDAAAFRDRGGDLAAKANGLKMVYTLGAANYGADLLQAVETAGSATAHAASPDPTISRHSATPAARPADPRARCAITTSFPASPALSSPTSKSRRRRATSRWRRSAMSRVQKCYRR